MESLLTTKIRRLRTQAEEIASEHLAPKAEQVDRECLWPEHAMKALSAAGLTGLHVPARLGGQEQGLLALAVTTEALAKGCSSSAMCYSMHCVATAVIAAKATPYQEQHYLRPIAEGRHLTSLAVSERGTGAHFYVSETDLKRQADRFVINGKKQFITSGGHADSYVVSTRTSDHVEAGEFNCLIVDKDIPGLDWQEPWSGFGMRGNSSRGAILQDAQVPVDNLLGNEGDEIWYMFKVITPYFLMAMSGAYLGIAQAAFDIALQHVQKRKHTHSGDSLANVGPVQQKIADMWISLQRTRGLVYSAAQLGDMGDANAMNMIIACKADVAQTVVSVTNEAMTVCGGIAYQDNSQLARLLRDARASHVMSPTTDTLREWTGKSILGLPLF